MDVPWRISLFGGLRAEKGARVITRFQTQKTGVLLAYLACHLQRTHPRELLVELLWPECDLDTGRHRLSVALSWLRQQLEPEGTPGGSVLVADRFAVGLNPAAVTTDVAEFEGALEAAAEAADAAGRARALVEAVDLYRGELLPGYYEDWIFPEQQRWAELFFQTLHRLIGSLEQAGDFDRALQYALRAVSADPLREEARRELMRLYAAAGQPGPALRQYHDLERLLKQELGEPPSPETRALADEIGRSGGTDHRRPTTDDRPPAATHHSSLITHPFTPSSPALEPVGGALPLDSRFYVLRPEDQQFRDAIARGDSIVLVKGARQVGKTSLLARGLQQARQAGSQVVRTDFEVFNASHLATAESLLLALADTIAEQLDLDALPGEVWDARRGPNPSFQRYLRREVLSRIPGSIVWGMDEVDRLFACDFGSEIFGLFRSWHNERALDPSGPWSRLTLAIAYATEAHLFITDLNKSPFNVGTRLTLDDFTVEQVADLNRRYGAPLKDEASVSRFYHLVGGHPYLVQRGLHEMAARGVALPDLEVRAADGEWIFGDHLRRMLAGLTRDPDLCAVMRGVLEGRPCPTPESFYRLRSAGVITGDSELNPRPRCRLYAAYLERHLP